MAKHYIRLDKNNNIIYGFSDKFKKPELDDICIEENGGRHFSLLVDNNCIINPILIDEKLKYKYQYVNDKVILADTNYNENDKREKLKEIKFDLFNRFNWIILLYKFQERLHEKNINKKERIISESLMDEWSLWFEEIMNVEDKISNWNNLNYNDISEDNIKLFPLKPDLPQI